MNITGRAGWGAAPPKSRSTFSAPASTSFIHHTVTTFPENGSVEQEKAHMRLVQSIGFNRGFADISYSFVIFQSGRVYEGRGWKVVGGHTVGHNSSAHAFTFVGNYENQTPTQAALKAAGELHRFGVDKGHIRADAAIRGHRDVSATACPGRNVYSRLGDIRKFAQPQSKKVRRWVIRGGTNVGGKWEWKDISGTTTLPNLGARLVANRKLRRRINNHAGKGKRVRLDPRMVDK